MTSRNFGPLLQRNLLKKFRLLSENYWGSPINAMTTFLDDHYDNKTTRSLYGDLYSFYEVKVKTLHLL